MMKSVMRLVVFVFGLVLCGSLFSQSTFAQQSELLERSYAGVSNEKNPISARRDIQEQASQKVSEEVIKELIGEDRFSKNRTLIAGKIIKNSQRYIPYVKPSEVTPEGEGFKMSVAMKLSLRDLKQLLQVNGLLGDNDAVPVVLPVVAWVDRVEGRSYRWWQSLNKENNPFLMKEARLFEDALRNGFQKNNFYSLKPIESGAAVNVPVDFQSEKLNSEDLQFYAQYFNAPLIVDGQVMLSKAEQKGRFIIEIKMSAIQVSNGRTIGDIARKFETDNGVLEGAVDKKIKEVAETVANDLASQVLDVWQRGSIGTSIIKVTVRGKNTLPLMESLKSKVRSSITQVKNIRERLVTSDSVSFEVDASISSSELLNKFTAMDLNGKKLGKISEDNDEIVLKWLD
jgi:hypothetical protein